MKIVKVTLDTRGVTKVVPGDGYGGPMTVIEAAKLAGKVEISELEDGSILLKGKRWVKLPAHRVIEVEYEAERATAGKK